jgi:hypothetical protein
LVEGGRARMSGFSANPSSTVGKAGGRVAVSVGFKSGPVVSVGVAVGAITRGSVQFVRKIALVSKKIVNKDGVRFTIDS